MCHLHVCKTKICLAALSVIKKAKSEQIILNQLPNFWKILNLRQAADSKLSTPQT